MDRVEIAVRNMLSAIEAPLYDVGVLGERGMLPRLAGISSAEVLDRLPLIKYRNVRGCHIYIRPSGSIKGDVKKKHSSSSARRGCSSDIQPHPQMYES